MFRPPPERQCDNTVRAEGMTELLGGIELKCAGGVEVLWLADPPAIIEISIELNTHDHQCNEDDDGDVVMGLTYTDADGMLTPRGEAESHGPWSRVPIGYGCWG